MTATRRNNQGPFSEMGSENSVCAENIRRPNDLSVVKFMQFEPPTFLGTESSEEAEEWLSRIEDLFEILGYPDNCKLRLAVHQLKGDGYKWWLGAKMGLESQYGAVSWDKFKTAFLSFYFPKSKRDAKYSEFLHLRQENLSVDGYTNKFLSLLKYVPSVLANKEAQILHFRQGLRPEIYDRVVATQADSYVELMHMAVSVENSIRAANQSVSSVRSIARACFACGQVGHLARNCPQRD